MTARSTSLIRLSPRMTLGISQFRPSRMFRIPRTAGTDSLIRIYNNDGSEAGACGNGMRCVASLITKESGRDKLTFEVDGRVLSTWRGADGTELLCHRFGTGGYCTYWFDVRKPGYNIDGTGANAGHDYLDRTEHALEAHLAKEVGRTATGPVMMCAPSLWVTASWIAR